MYTKSRELRNRLFSESTEFFMEAHNALSARIVEETGFSAIWASGLSISTAFGLRDANEASWTQVLDNLEFMSDATSIPILVDGDTGYGNFNSVRRFVQKLCNRGLAGVCIEDKLFPKTNSFIGEKQPLAEAYEFCGKVKAAKDSQLDSDFCVVARVEALVSGFEMSEAINRAHLYVEAGADAILIHSKQETASEILHFAHLWENKAPLVIVPTKYFKTPTSTFRNAKISCVIWANQNLRASIAAMKAVSSSMKSLESLVEVEPRIATLEEVFSLVNTKELLEAEQKYLSRA